MLVVLVIFAHDHMDKCDDDQNDKTNEKRCGVNQECRHKTSDPRAVKNLLEVRKFKDVVSKLRFPYPSRKEHMSTGRALSSTGLWRDLVNAGELKAG